ncbi:MAG TPA: hypothetical protein PLI09_27915 [Candidatus Hydrogenedentes bacterium]|nr:hypothetical protein [Candidatus Hydrogenedentota bacterium]
MARVRKPSAKRNLVIFSLIALTFAGVAVSIRFINQEPEYILPERQGITQVPKEENGFFDVDDASKMIPRDMTLLRPIPIPHPVHPEKTILYQMQEYDLGKLVKVDRPDSDPDFLAWMHKSEPALEKIRSALSKPHFQLPYKPKIFHHNQYDFNALVALGGALGRVEKKPEEGLALLLDLVRIDRKIEEMPRLSANLESLALRECRMIARMCDSPEILAAFQQHVQELGIPCPDRRVLLEQEWEVLDNALSGEEDPTGAEYIIRDRAPRHPRRHRDWGHRLGDIYMNWRVRQITALIIRHKAELYEMADRPLDEIQTWYKDRPISKGKRMLWSTPENGVLNAATSAVSRNSEYLVTLVAVALERYRLDHGEYPETLEALAPKYMESIPNNPENGAPFAYQRTKRCYAIARQPENWKGRESQQQQSFLIPVEEVRAALTMSGALNENTQS